MVLNKYLACVVVVFCINGCSLLTNSGQQRQQVIPAYTDPDENQSEMQDEVQTGEQVEVIKTSDQRSSTAANQRATDQPRQRETKVLSSGSTSNLPYPLIVRNLIERAEKAVKMQQWLRAQHILEQGLHIAPNNAKVFLIYGDVYLNLGILAQAEQMYRRSIALAGDESPMGRLANTKLKALKTGN